MVVASCTPVGTREDHSVNVHVGAHLCTYLCRDPKNVKSSCWSTDYLVLVVLESGVKGVLSFVDHIQRTEHQGLLLETHGSRVRGCVNTS